MINIFKSIKENVGKYFSELFSINETRKSAVVLVLLIITIYGITTGKDIQPNVMTTILTLSGIIFGTNSINGISGIINSVKSNASQVTNMINTQEENNSQITDSDQYGDSEMLNKNNNIQNPV